MKEFNKEEFNKLCAEFMGYKLCYLDSTTKEHPFYNHNDKYIKPKAIIRIDKGEKLEFDSDWNWIMEVVEEIRHHYYGIGGSGFQLKLQRELCNPTKEAIVQAIWEFLNWYKDENNK